VIISNCALQHFHRQAAVFAEAFVCSSRWKTGYPIVVATAAFADDVKEDPPRHSAGRRGFHRSMNSKPAARRGLPRTSHRTQDSSRAFIKTGAGSEGRAITSSPAAIRATKPKPSSSQAPY